VLEFAGVLESKECGDGRVERVIWVVLDSVGFGELPDAADYGDGRTQHAGHVAESATLRFELVRLGLANIAPLKHLQPAAAPLGAYGKGATRSPGKDTTHRPLGNGRGVAGPGVPRV